MRHTSNCNSKTFSYALLYDHTLCESNSVDLDSEAIAVPKHTSRWCSLGTFLPSISYMRFKAPPSTLTGSRRRLQQRHLAVVKVHVPPKIQWCYDSRMFACRSRTHPVSTHKSALTTTALKAGLFSCSDTIYFPLLEPCD